MRKCIPILLLSLLVSFDVPLFAQDDAPKSDSEREVREGRGGREGGRRRGGRRRGPDMEAFYQRLTGEIEMDEDQLAALEDIKAAQQQRMEEFRAKRQEIRAAREAGDDETADRLREEMRAGRGMRRGGPMGETIEQIEGILNEDQLAQFQTVRQTMRDEREQRMRERFDERYEQIATDLDLDDDQRAVLEDIKATQLEDMEAYRARWQEVRQAYDDGDEETGDALREELVAEMRESGGPRAFMNRAWDELDPVLTEDQRVLAQEMRESRRDRRRDRREERQQAASDAAPSETATGESVPTLGSLPVSVKGQSNDDAASDMADLPGMLKLDADQQQLFGELQTEHTANQLATTSRLTDLKTQMMAAMEAGDTEGVALLKAEMATVLEAGEKSEAQFMENVNAMLDDEQRDAFASFRVEQEITDDLKGIDADLRDVLRAAMRLKLERTQKQQVRELAKGARDRLKKARKTDRKNRDRERTAEKQLADQVRADVMRLLTSEQSTEYMAALEKLSKKRSRGSSRR